MGSGSFGYSTTTMVLMMESEHYPQLEAAVTVIHLGFPALSFLYFGLATIITVCTLQTQSLRIRDQQVRRNVILTLILAVAGTYIIEAITLAVKCYNGPESNFSKDTSQDRVVYLLASTITFGLEALALSDAKFPVWYPYYGTWFFGIAAEITLVILTNVIQGPPKTPFQYVFNAIRILRVCLFLVLPGLYFGLRNDRKEYDNADAEQQALLSKKFGTKASSSEDSTTKGYGATSDTTAQDSESSSEAESEDSWLAEQRKAQALISKRLKQDGNWFTYAKGFAIFFPYLWPVHSKTLQFRAVLVGVCLLASNAMNVLVPRQLGKMIDSLTDYDSKSGIDIWSPVVIYAILVFISGGACIGWIRKWLWLPVEQYSYDALSTASHAHLMSLSSDFHDNKSSADLTQAVSGGRSVSNLLDTVCFSIVPMFIDLIIAFGYLSALFGPYMGLILVVEAIAYLYTTTKLVSLRAEKRREYVAIYRKEWTVGQQSLDGWTTASLFNQIPYERHRYSRAVKEHMDSKRAYELSSQSITASQGAVMAIGLLGALSLGVYQVAYSGMSVGKLTQLLVYWGQLQSPLSFFSNMYRNISYSLMDAERLLELFQTKPTITDHPKAKPLNLVHGEVVFNNVSFAYDERKPTLKNVSFVVPSGKTVALVGETGGGKTTILKLIDRFYDCKSGGISIDGQDIRDVTLDSLRSRIGVVPQDPMMFHDSVMNNIRYARLTASDEDVYKACKAAALHDKIMSFPDGYNSKVGDRGVKLSGGEKQRVAIARAMLKEPEIILLDEATSAVDTETESQIQEGFKTLCKDRTTFIVAHRLSTVMRADYILVVMNGEIVEQGSHYELIHKKGKYHDLWSKQIFVMPNNDRARSKSPKKRDADLINDLTPERRTVELAKALKTTEHSEVSCSAESQEGNATTVAKPADNKNHGDHNREGSKLKPDAPEFVPHVQFESQVARQKSESKPTKNVKDEKNERKGDSLKGGKKGNRGEANRSSNSEASYSTDPSNIPVVDGYGSGEVKKPKLRHVRSSRRQNAKSEPPNQSRQSMDGAQESDMTPVGSIEGQLLIPGTSPQQKRRVSAPSDPPAGAQDSRKRRPRRGRHWRLKNRVADKVGSSLSGAMSSGDASVDYAATPAPPTTTPEEGVPLINPTLSLAPDA